MGDWETGRLGDWATGRLGTRGSFVIHLLSTIHYLLKPKTHSLPSPIPHLPSKLLLLSHYVVKLRNIKKNSPRSIQLRIIFTESFVLLTIFNKLFKHLSKITGTCLEY
jgi:hypothetical protein